MRAAPLVAGLLALAAALPGARAEAKKRKKKDADATTSGAWQTAVEVKATTGAGVVSGEGTIRDGGGVVRLGVRAVPSFERDAWRLAVPVKADTRQTFGASLSETVLGAGFEARWRRSPRLRLEGGLGLSGTLRPDWPDLYQPRADGTLAPTDRYSHLDVGVEVGVAGIPLRHQHARLSYAFTVIDYEDDPSFDAVDEPTHLTPSDRTEHEIAGSWRYLGDGWKLGGGLDLAVKHWSLVYARDAGTGRTHAGAGGPPPNPLQLIVYVEPKVEGELELGGGWELGGALGWEFADDTFQGYYSYQGPHPQLELRGKPAARVELEARAELSWRTYGANSYAPGGSHPPLEYGDRRVDRRGKVGVEAGYTLSEHWGLFVDTDLIVRRTNFPDYVPGVFPDSRQYDVRWDYTNWLAIAGVRYSR
jgi:hypothetical protein